MDVDHKVHTFKARVVSKGFEQIHELDYEEPFSNL